MRGRSTGGGARAGAAARTLTGATLAGAVLAGSVLTGCGAAAEHVGVGAPTTGNTTTTTGNTTTTTVTAPTDGRPSSSATPTCAAGDLVAGQAPLSSGVGESSLVWSVTNTGPAACILPAGPPSLAFVDAAGDDVAHYAVSHLPGNAAAPVTLARRGRAWFVTTERTTTCGVGVTIAGGPFRYEVGLPGGVGRIPWAPSYLSAKTLDDFCADVSLGVGDLGGTEPTST